MAKELFINAEGIAAGLYVSKVYAYKLV